jgi:hypothetical protein
MDSSFIRTPAVPINTIPGALPTASILENVDHGTAGAAALKLLPSLAREHLTDEAIWRDQWALTSTARTFFGPSRVLAAWTELTVSRKPANFALVPNSSRVMVTSPDSSWVHAGFTFELQGEPGCVCSGFIGLVPAGNGDSATGGGGGWNIWMLTTILEVIKGLPSPDSLLPVVAAAPQQEALVNGNYSSEGVNGDMDDYSFDCVVVGGGMAGLSVAGRLKAMDVSSVTLERNPQIGDNWLMRYDSAKRAWCIKFL